MFIKNLKCLFFSILLVYQVVFTIQYPTDKRDSLEKQHLKEYLRDVYAEKQTALREKKAAQKQIEDFKRNYALQKVTSDGPDFEKVIMNYQTPNPCRVCFSGYRPDEDMTTRKPYRRIHKKSTTQTL